MRGGVGSDTYVVDNTSDIVDETGGTGIDAVLSSLSFDLGNAARALGGIEALTLTGKAVRSPRPATTSTMRSLAMWRPTSWRASAAPTSLVGGDGLDTASYAASDAGVRISLMTGTASGGHATGDTLAQIENVTGSAFDDVLEGDGGANVLIGGSNQTGGDTLTYANASAGVVVNLA